ncbi:MAG TPA: sensor domain-containing phosphodiesterase [Dyella sp.]|uniref:putative bifunctional diguanylate cyclase/phosphodiesterase n=1 Tax=Dyella sp. TaxID=1869338 RepID=UPI002D78E287|nr:sensor domain-containing phosphodiesterase [Dyella sp.]HET6553550.1 sensor domain-containing phosphodiesterase [Dyella sp.]
MRSSPGWDPRHLAPGHPDATKAAVQTSSTLSPDSFAVPGFDAVVRLVSRSLHVPLVALVLNGGNAYWFAHGSALPPHEPRMLHPLYLEAARSLDPQVVLDTLHDPRLQGSALTPGTTQDPVRFFASEPVCTLTGQQIGALCVMGMTPRTELSESEQSALRDAASLIGAGVVLRSYLGRTDPITQLPHRYAFFDDLRRHLHDEAPHAWVIAIDLAPVQRFNAFIRAMGHAYADELMRAVAQRALAWLPPDTRLYQVGASRFAAVLPDRHVEADTTRLDDLVSRLRQPFDCLGIPLTIQPGVGLLKINQSELRGGDPLRLVMNASHEAQHSVRGWAVYDRKQDELHRQQFFLVTELAAALTDRTELDLHYQPRVDLESGRCVALEALARWQHPTLGQVPPSHFVALAERAGLMRSLTQWVLERGVAQLAAWRRDGHDIKLSVNVSSTDLDADLVGRLREVAEHHKVGLDSLELEFTESTLMEHSATTRRHLTAIRQLGTGIAIDDFGTGYSNLAALRQMPATSLKIDQSFVRGMGTNHHDEAIVRSVAQLARNLGFRVVVEGVETHHLYDSVLGMACDEAQGFHISRPMPSFDIPPWLAAHRGMPRRADALSTPL